jgi:hypothetical protein
MSFPSRFPAMLSILLGLSWAGATPSAGLDERILKNETPHIVSPCYTKTVDDQGRVHNPCYACHTQSQAPNYLNDQDLQLTFSFPGAGRGESLEESLQGSARGHGGDQR